MQSLNITRGETIRITDAEGNELEVEALSGVEETTHGFAVVWVNRPLYAGGFEPTPWPLEAIVTGEFTGSKDSQDDLADLRATIK